MSTVATDITSPNSAPNFASLLVDLRAELGDDSCIDDSSIVRAYYSSDSSIYRVVPTAVAQPRTTDELLRVVRAALKVGMPITGRGAGTSLCGNSITNGLVIDMGRHLNKVLAIDPITQTAVVQPGVVHSALQDAAKPYGLRFGPDPATADRCAIGGMIGNNACGARALGYGRTADNVVALQVVTGTGDVIMLGEGGDTTQEPLPELAELTAAHLGCIRTEFAKFTRQTSGYALEHLLPEKGFNVAKFFVGSEATLGIVLQAKVRLVVDAPIKQMIALGYDSMDKAGDDIPNLNQFHPVAAEGLDERTIDVVRRMKGSDAVPPLPNGCAFIFIELVGDDATEVESRTQALLAATKARDAWKVDDPDSIATLWKIRTDAAGLSGIGLARPAHSSWEDAAVPPESLGAYLRDFEALLNKHELHGLPYGHFGEGCIHCRIDFPLDQPGGTDIYRAFMLDAGDLVAKYGGSMSGEHGDGRARSELLSKMYSPEALQAFGEVKAVFDPKNLLNPGVVVNPLRTDNDIRIAQTLYSPLRLSDREFTDQVHRCTGVAKCLANATALGNVMCPSYQATGNQLHSTKGRARILQEMINGQIVKGWDAPELAAALDLCLACKGCRRDCPTGSDMAAYKSRVLYERYRHKLRPLSHYVLGWLPRWGRLMSKMPFAGTLANLALQTPGLKHLALAVAGVDIRRPMPKFRTTGAARKVAQVALSQRTDLTELTELPKVVIWVDSFTDSFVGSALPALLKVLLAAGYHPQLLDQDACCGLTWITTGQLAGARANLKHALDVLTPIAEAGVPIVGMEPSCIAVWRSDAQDLLPDDPRVQLVAKSIHTLAEFLNGVPEFSVPDLSGHTIVAQPHCHHASVLGWAADAKLLKRSGAKVVKVGGCCGLAGNFGVEKGHYEVSVKVFEHDLAPAIAAAGANAIVLADGFSCRKQVSDLSDRQALTLAEVLAAHLPPIC
ncbi:MAG: FAD-binding protein [Propionibacteriaceae bacterium]|jgi:FAD/FMN-containing dehydrogenase|nr:FAD-binding protein [Propionibacteriaceae bacterium]